MAVDYAKIAASNEAQPGFGYLSNAANYRNIGKSARDIQGLDAAGTSITGPNSTSFGAGADLDNLFLDAPNHFASRTPAPSPGPPPAAPTPTPAPSATPDPIAGGGGPPVAAPAAAPSQQPLQMLSAPPPPPSGYGSERTPELDPNLTDRVLPASGRALQQLAAQRGGRIY